MKKILFLLVILPISLALSQDRLTRLPVGDDAIREQFAKQIEKIRLSISRSDNFVRVTNKTIMSSSSWYGNLSLIKNLAEEISSHLDPNTEYVWWWGLFSRLQSGALVGMTSEDDVIYFKGKEIQSSINKMIERIDNKIFEGYIPIYAPGVKAVRFTQRDISTGEIKLREFSPNGAFGCEALLKKAGDGWLWLPVVNLRPIDDRDRRFYLYYSEDLSDWDELDVGWGSKGDLIASSRGPIPPKLIISRVKDNKVGSDGILVRIAGLKPQEEYEILRTSSLPFSSDSADVYFVQADRLGVIFITLPVNQGGQSGGGFLTLSTNFNSSSPLRRLKSPATLLP